jgi:hypothetical protein
MNKYHTVRRLIGLVVLLGLLFSATPALAADDSGPPDGEGVVIWNEDYTLEEGERLEGDLIVFNGDVTLEVDSRVEGSVVVWGGSADVEGTIENELVVSGGDIYLGDDAWVQGTVVCSWSCDLQQSEGARVDGGITEGSPWEEFDPHRWRGFTWPPDVPSPARVWVSGPGWVANQMLKVVRGTVSILVIAAVAGLVALLWPQPTAQVGRAVMQAPWHSFGMGLLVAIAAATIIVVLAITICLSPVAILGGLALLAAGLFGWICIGALVGEQLLQAFKARETAPMWAAGLGTFAITAVAVLLDLVPCINILGWLAISVVGCMGLGAVVLTRCGTMVYTPAVSPQAPSPPSPPSATAPVETPAPSKPVEEETGDS